VPSKLPFPIPSPSRVTDRMTRDVLTAMESNLRALYGETANIRNAALTVGAALDAGIAVLDRGMVSAASSTGGASSSSSGSGSLVVSASGWYAGVLNVPAGGLGVGTYPIGIRLPRLGLVRNSFIVVTDALASAGSLATVAAGVDVDAPAGILAATVISAAGLTVGNHAGVQDGTVAKFTPITDTPRDVIATVGVECLTAGRVVVVVEIIAIV